MRPLVVLLGIVMGSTVSIALTLLLIGVVYLLMPEYGERLAEEKGQVFSACLIAVFIAALAVTSFYAELRSRSWRYAAHVALALILATVLWVYWPKQ